MNLIKIYITFLIVVLMLFLGSSANADINFKGVCGSIDYKLQIPTNKYFGAHCMDDRLVTYNDTTSDKLVGIFADVNTSQIIDIYNLQTFAIVTNFNASQNGGFIKYIGDPSTVFLMSLAGLLCGYFFIQIVFRMGSHV